MAYELAAAPPVLFRVGRWPHPFNWWPPRAALDPTHPRDGHRWDDPAGPDGSFSTLYLATDPIGCFLETLPYYKSDPDFEARIQQATEQPTAGYVGPLATNEVADDYFVDRVLGRARLADGATFIDLDHPRTHAELTAQLTNGALPERLASVLADYGVAEFDRSVVMHQDRRITRLLAAYVYAIVPANIAGIRYESRRYRDTECWAMWERASDALSDPEGDGLTPHMPELKEAAELLGLTLPADVPHPDR